MQQPHVLDLKRAQVAGRQLLAANDPLSHADRALAAMFDGPLDGEPSIRDVVAEASMALAAYGRGDAVAFRSHANRARQLDAQRAPVPTPANT
jgi:hypothetical protein